MNRPLAAIIVVAAVSIPGVSSAAPILWGLGANIPPALHSIDPSTGIATHVTNVQASTAGPVGLEWLDGKLWASNLAFGFSEFIGTIDTTTGAVTPVAAQTSIDWAGLAGDADASVLYSVDVFAGGSPLFRITTSGVVTNVGPTGQRIRGLAFDNANDILYGVAFEPSGNVLYSINTATAVATLIGPTGLSNPDIGLAFDDSTGALYLNEGRLIFGGGNNLYRVNTSTGAATLIGANGVLHPIGALAFQPEVVPEPTLMLLLGTGLAGILVRRYRHARP